LRPKKAVSNDLLILVLGLGQRELDSSYNQKYFGKLRVWDKVVVNEATNLEHKY